MTPASLHDLFLGASSVAGGLIGLLFVAVSIAHERLTAGPDGQAHRIRAAAVLTAFTNALTASLLALVPDGSLGAASMIVGVLGLGFIAASMLSLRQSLRRLRLRDAMFLLGLCAVYAQQVIAGAIFRHSHRLGDAEWLSILVIACFLIGVQRAWELIGGPDVGLSHEVVRLVRDGQPAEPDAPRAVEQDGQQRPGLDAVCDRSRRPLGSPSNGSIPLLCPGVPAAPCPHESGPDGMKGQSGPGSPMTASAPSAIMSRPAVSRMSMAHWFAPLT